MNARVNMSKSGKHQHNYKKVFDDILEFEVVTNVIDEMSEMFKIPKKELKQFEGKKEKIWVQRYKCRCGKWYETHSRPKERDTINT